MWSKVIRLTIRHDFIRALKIINRIEVLCPLTIDMKLFRGMLYSRIGDKESAVNLLESAYLEIDSISKYSEDEKKLLEVLCF